jgi:hypothetical protein
MIMLKSFFMRRLFLFITLLTATSVVSFAQFSKFSINATGGYTFQDKVSFDAGKAYANEALQYGGSLEFFPSRNKSFELSYSYMSTEMPVYGLNGNQINKTAGKGGVSYILAGGNTYFAKTNNAKAMPFLGGGIGVGILNNSGQSSTNFAWNIKTGVKIKTASVLSFKLNAYLQSMIGTAGNDYWYTWYGVVAVQDYASLFQFGLGASVCIDFPGK